MFNSEFATTKDHLINEILTELYETREHRLHVEAFLAERNLAFATKPLAKKFAELVIEQMLSEDLIVTTSENYVKQLSAKGKKIVETGGWLKYLLDRKRDSNDML